MRTEEKRQLSLVVILLVPTVFWMTAVQKTEVLTSPKLFSLWGILKATPTKPILLVAAVAGILIAGLIVWAIHVLGKNAFEGAEFKQHLRGTKIVSESELKSLTTEKKVTQIDIAGVPLPKKDESLHILVQGVTGTGKSVLFQNAAWSGMKRGDRFIITDPNADMLTRFFRPGDKILNVYDERTEGWSFFNEIRNDYDFERYALSVVPRGENTEAEEWASYGRLLLAETARKLWLRGRPSVQELFHWTTIADADTLKEFLVGTHAESLFVGAEKALASARFVLSAKLPAHLKMPPGNFSLREWLENPNAGNLYIPWREDQRVALKPILSAWVDVLASSILSLNEDRDRRIFLLLDELDSLEKLASLEAMLTKGRKNGACVIAGIQSTAQLNKTYGVEEAKTLRSCFRSLVVLGGSRTDPATCEDMSKSLGTHEIIRDRQSQNSGEKSSKTTSEEIKEERVVSPSQIASLPDLTAYVAFAGRQEIAKVSYEPTQFVQRTERFVERFV